MHIPLSLVVMAFVFCGIQLPIGPKKKPHDKKPIHYHYNPKSKENLDRRRKYMNLIAPLDAAILSLRHELRCNFHIFNLEVEMPMWFGQPRTVASSIRRLQRMKQRIIHTYQLYRVFEPIP